MRAEEAGDEEEAEMETWKASDLTLRDDRKRVRCDKDCIVWSLC